MREVIVEERKMIRKNNFDMAIEFTGWLSFFDAGKIGYRNFHLFIRHIPDLSNEAGFRIST